jgi:hypothetical protein
VLGQREHVDHHRHQPANAIVHRGGEPGRPAPLARPGRHEARDVEAPAIVGQSLGGVHPLDRRLDHRQQEGPGGVAGLDELDEGVGDQVVLDHPVEHRLVGHLPDDRCRQAGRRRDRGEDAHRLGRLADLPLGQLPARAAVDPEKHLIGVGERSRAEQ